MHMDASCDRHLLTFQSILSNQASSFQHSCQANALLLARPTEKDTASPMWPSRLRAVRTAVGLSYLAGAVCWILNACLSGWPQPGHARVEAYLRGVSALLGALLFHIGAMCQLWESLNSRQQSTRLPSSTLQPWLLASSDPSKLSLDASSSSNMYGTSCSSIGPNNSSTVRQLLRPRAQSAGAEVAALQSSQLAEHQCTSSFHMSSCFGGDARPASTDSRLRLLGGTGNETEAAWDSHAFAAAGEEPASRGFSLLQKLKRARSTTGGHSSDNSTAWGHSSVVPGRPGSASGRSSDGSAALMGRASSLAGRSDGSEVQLAECSSPGPGPPFAVGAYPAGELAPAGAFEQQPLLLGALPSSLPLQQLQQQLQQHPGSWGGVGGGKSTRSRSMSPACASDSPPQHYPTSPRQQGDSSALQACRNAGTQTAKSNGHWQPQQQQPQDHQQQQRQQWLPAELAAISFLQEPRSSKSWGSKPSITAAGEGASLVHEGRWVWWAWQPDNLSFMAALVQVTGTTIFAAACVCGFPGVLPTNYAAGDWRYWDALFWSPFLLGSCLFITSALLSLRDCQGGWVVQPQCKAASWWMHVANTVGSVGFWLCSFFGFFAYPAQKYQRWGMAFSCLWGSCCFAVAAHLQLLLACG